MLTPTIIDPATLRELGRIGDLRRPNEACGVLLPFPWRGKRIWEMPNRADRPHDSFSINSSDIVMTLQDWVDENEGVAMWEDIVLWHTHPNGAIGPSRIDLDNRISDCGNLVVTLTDDGPTATWF
jgi:proteasome lid subunit RPN8/RPN11